MQKSEDKRADRTRQALVEAFNDLVLSSHQGKIRVADIIQKADVGRSTFYDHFRGSDAIHLEALSAPMAILADAILGNAADQELNELLDHFYKNRQRACEMFADSSTRDQLTQLLAELIEHRSTEKGGNPDTRLVNRLVAESAMAAIRVWITNELACEKESIAVAIVQTSQLMRNGLAASVEHKRGQSEISNDD